MTEPKRHENRIGTTPVPLCESCGEETRAVGGAIEGKRRYQCVNRNCSNRRYYRRESAPREVSQ